MTTKIENPRVNQVLPEACAISSLVFDQAGHVTVNTEHGDET
jgi:hypothetical protein